MRTVPQGNEKTSQSTALQNVNDKYCTGPELDWSARALLHKTPIIRVRDKVLKTKKPCEPLERYEKRKIPTARIFV